MHTTVLYCNILCLKNIKIPLQLLKVYDTAPCARCVACLLLIFLCACGMFYRLSIAEVVVRCCCYCSVVIVVIVVVVVVGAKEQVAN